MTRILFLLFAFMLVTAANSQPRKFNDLIGTWQITGEQKASLQVIDSNTIILTYMGEKKNVTNYKIDFTKTPIWFDFSTEDDGSKVHVKSLLEITGDDMIKWQLFVDEDRTPHFSSTKGEMFYLRKRRTAEVIASN